MGLRGNAGMSQRVWFVSTPRNYNLQQIAQRSAQGL
jgi:hypothetical protein